MYSVILLYYPFINHRDEKVEETMFGFFTYINVKLTIKALEESLIRYVTYCTKGVTFAVWQKCEDPNLAVALDELNTNVYREENIKRFVEKMMFDMKKKRGENVLVEKEDFKNLMMKWNLSSCENIRAMMTSEF